MKFAGKTVAITGGGSGIGRALALEFAGRQSNLLLCDVNGDSLAETAAECRAQGADVDTAIVDVAERQAVEEWANRGLERFGAVDAIINNAGVSVSETLADITYEDFEWIVGINFWGVVYGTKAFLPHMLERGSGWVVNISSVFGIVAVRTQGAYNATKFAVRGFTEALHQELVGTGVHALCVHPGGVRTNIARAARFHTSALGGDRQDVVEMFDKAARTSPEKAAATIIRAMEKGKHRVLVGADAAVAERIQRWFPESYGKVFDRLVPRR